METKLPTKLKVEGMTCQMCVGHVAKALQSTPGVTEVAVDLETNSALVEGDNLDHDQLIAAVREEGYDAQIARE